MVINNQTRPDLNKIAWKGEYHNDWWKGANDGLDYLKCGYTPCFWIARNLAITLWPSPIAAYLFGYSHVMYTWR
jgi:hypothetical protein